MTVELFTVMHWPEGLCFSSLQHASDTGPSPDVVRPSATPSKQGKDDAATSSSPQSRIGESADTPPLLGWGRGSGEANNFTLFQPFNRLNQHGLAASTTVGREWTEVDGSQPLSLHPWYAAYMTYRAWTLQQRSVECSSTSLLVQHVCMRCAFHYEAIVLPNSRNEWSRSHQKSFKNTRCFDP